jgi:hypothetical protein
MPEINAAAGALTIPIWAVGAMAAVFLVLIMLAVAQAGTATVMNTLFRTVIVVAVIAAGWLYVQSAGQQEKAALRRSLDERSAALLARAVTPGSALACLNGLAGETIEGACEKAIFASPEQLSAAVTYVSAQVSLLLDGAVYASRFDPAYFAEMAQLQTGLRADQFGIAAHVFATRGCSVDNCDIANIIGDPSHMLANLRDQVFAANMAKYAAAWNVSRAPAAETAAAPRPATVSSQYDFPSSASIPPVNIMAPEPAATPPATPRSAPGAGRQQAAAPMPPRRPQQARAPSRPAAPPPVAVGEAPTDGSGTASQQQQ